jgi:hypothetical protein
MNINHIDSEKGQVIVYLVLGIIVFFGFVALAIDGGMALADRRNSQNSADAASLAGGGAAAMHLEADSSGCYAEWTCDTGALYDAEEAAIDRAGENGFSISKTDFSQHNDVDAVCDSITYNGYVDKFIDVTVEMSATTPSNFIQLIFPSALHNEVDAVTRVHPPQPLGFGNAIVALNPNDCSGHTNGIIVSGSGETFVDGGGIFSNGCLRGNGTFLTTIEGGAYPAGHELDPGNLDFWTPDPVTTDIFITTDELAIPEPDCSDPDANNWTANKLEQEGILDPGLYCVTGNVSLQGAHNMLHGDGVTIYLINGSFTTNGNSDIQLSSIDAVDPAIPGITIYLPATNNNTVTINGNSSSFYEGVMFAPSSLIKMDGTGDTMYQNSQVIGWNVTVGGTADTQVIYDSCGGFTRSAAMELSK